MGVKTRRLLLPAILVIEVVAVATGVMDLQQGLLAVLLFEATLAAVVLAEGTRAVLAVRATKRPDNDWSVALEQGLATVMPHGWRRWPGTKSS